MGENVSKEIVCLKPSLTQSSLAAARCYASSIVSEPRWRWWRWEWERNEKKKSRKRSERKIYIQKGNSNDLKNWKMLLSLRVVELSSSLRARFSHFLFRALHSSSSHFIFRAPLLCVEREAIYVAAGKVNETSADGCGMERTPKKKTFSFVSLNIY